MSSSRSVLQMDLESEDNEEPTLIPHKYRWLGRPVQWCVASFNLVHNPKCTMVFIGSVVNAKLCVELTVFWITNDHTILNRSSFELF